MDSRDASSASSGSAHLRARAALRTLRANREQNASTKNGSMPITNITATTGAAASSSSTGSRSAVAGAGPGDNGRCNSSMISTMRGGKNVRLNPCNSTSNSNIANHKTKSSSTSTTTTRPAGALPAGGAAVVLDSNPLRKSCRRLEEVASPSTTRTEQDHRDTTGSSSSSSSSIPRSKELLEAMRRLLRTTSSSAEIDRAESEVDGAGANTAIPVVASTSASSTHHLPRPEDSSSSSSTSRRNYYSTKKSAPFAVPMEIEEQDMIDNYEEDVASLERKLLEREAALKQDVAALEEKKRQQRVQSLRDAASTHFRSLTKNFEADKNIQLDEELTRARELLYMPVREQLDTALKKVDTQITLLEEKRKRLSAQRHKLEGDHEQVVAELTTKAEKAKKEHREEVAMRVLAELKMQMGNQFEFPSPMMTEAKDSSTIASASSNRGKLELQQRSRRIVDDPSAERDLAFFLGSIFQGEGPENDYDFSMR